MTRGLGGQVAALALAAAPLGAQAADCPQQRAIYRDADNAYELSFLPASDAESATHRFSLQVLKSKTTLDGYVMGSEPVDRTAGMIFYNCPEGDVTGKDIADCTVWHGVVYGQSGDKIDLLPAQDKLAAQAILLPDFGPSIRKSKLWKDGKATVVPWDVLSLKGCAP